MKKTLVFDLPEEKAQSLLAEKAGDVMGVLWDYDEWLRDLLKYGVPKDSKLDDATLEQCRDKLTEIQEEYGVRFDELWH